MPITTEKNLDNEVQALATARQQYEERKATLDAARAAWEMANRNLLDSVAQLKEDMDTAETTLRERALAVYATTDNKKPHEAVEVKLWDTTTYDEQEALTWARLNMTGLLVLDTSAYDKLLREVRGNKNLTDVLGDMPGHVGGIAKPSVKRDLSAWLPVETKEDGHDSANTDGN
jgi:hypothetical protein